MQRETMVAADQVRIGDILEATIDGDAKVTGVQFNADFPDQIDLTVDYPDDPSMPAKTLIVSRRMLLSVVRQT